MAASRHALFDSARDGRRRSCTRGVHAGDNDAHARGMRTEMLNASVIVTTHNRATLLANTLASVARSTYRGAWDVIVVDNNSTDSTYQVIAEAQRTFPVPLRYVAETRPGKYAAL